MEGKQIQLTFEQGITNVPSDALCSDNALEESLGLVYENGEHRVIQKPRLIMNTNLSVRKLLYVHNYNNVKRYIFAATLEGSSNKVYSYGIQEGTTFHELGVLGRDESTDPATDTFFYEEGSRITSIGKTIIITDSDGIHYFLWKEGTYDKVESIPSQDVEFFMYEENRMSVYFRKEPSLQIDESGIPKDQEAFNDLVVGIYAKQKNIINQKKAFCLPFFVRTALQLYDGTYTHISQPILMFPSITTNTEITNTSWDGGTLKMISGSTFYSKLYYINKSNINNELVKNISVFVSQGIELYDTTVDQKVTSHSADQEQNKHDGIFRVFLNAESRYHRADDAWPKEVLTRRDEREIIGDIKSTSIFYKIGEIELKGDSQPHDIGDVINRHTLENLTTQEQLKEDDYYSRSALVPEFIYAYNSRLNIANVSRSFFEGYHDFLPYDNVTSDERFTSDPHYYWFYVTIRTDSGNKTIRHTALTAQKQGIYFFYPDPRASHVLITKADTNDPTQAQVILDVDLTEHQGLNGAYYLRDTLPTANEPETPLNPQPSIPSEDTLNNNDRELLPNYIIQSEVNNPFVFKAEGYHKVSTGKILAMSSTTMALSQDQFGKTDLLVFSDAGLWGLQVDRTGTYDSIHPITRDVLTHASTVTQTDGAVFFATKKGLMVVSENGVACVSEQLNTMAKFLDSDKVRIAYDYRDSLLWLFNPAEPARAFVYGMKSRTFASFDTTNMPIEGVVADYPDNLLQDSSGRDSSGRIWSLIERPDIHDDEGAYSATLITRPMTLDSPYALKSIRQIRHIKDMEGNVTLRIFGSNDLKNWRELTTLRSIPWKYFRFRYDFTDLTATDRFVGAVLITQERRTNKIR